MPKNPRHRRPYEERLAESLERWPDEALVAQMPDVVTLGRWVDDDGTVWAVRQRLSEGLTKRLAGSADVVVVGSTGGGHVVIPPGEASMLWADIQKHGRAPADGQDPHVAYTPVELDAADGRVALYLWRSC